MFPVPSSVLAVSSLELLVVEIETADAYVLVRAIGEIDLSTAPLLADRLLEAGAAAPPGGAVVLDLTPVEFLGSAGLAVLLDHHQRLDAIGVPLRLVVVGGAVARVFEITEVTKVLRVFSTVEDAATA